VSDNIQAFARCDRLISAAFGLTKVSTDVLDEEMMPLLDTERAVRGETLVLQDALRRDVSELIQIAKARGISGRFVTKKEYVADRRCELALLLSGRPAAELKLREPPLPKEPNSGILQISFHLLWAPFSAAGTYGLLRASGLPGRYRRFAPLPLCPPSQLQNEKALPLTRRDSDRLRQRDSGTNPIDVPWDGSWWMIRAIRGTLRPEFNTLFS